MSDMDAWVRVGEWLWVSKGVHEWLKNSGANELVDVYVSEWVKDWMNEGVNKILKEIREWSKDF